MAVRYWWIISFCTGHMLNNGETEIKAVIKPPGKHTEKVRFQRITVYQEIMCMEIRRVPDNR
eukprot:UN08253